MSRIANFAPMGSLLKGPKGSHKARRKRDMDPGHLTALRACPCVVCLRTPAEAAHIRMGSPEHGKPMTGIGIRPDDRWCLSLCPWHHRLAPDAQHKGSEREFYERHGIDPFALAVALYAASPDIEAMTRIIVTYFPAAGAGNPAPRPDQSGGQS
jgi:hypothetical protein